MSDEYGGTRLYPANRRRAREAKGDGAQVGLQQFEVPEISRPIRAIQQRSREALREQEVALDG